MIVPDSSSIANFDTNTTDLAYAAAMWNKILFDLVKLKMNVNDALPTRIKPSPPPGQLFPEGAYSRGSWF
jgi:hypothetical protein